MGNWIAGIFLFLLLIFMLSGVYAVKRKESKNDDKQKR